ncbi:hypothetical protein [Sphingobacterium griseoflavum]|uniref:Uncharacterized protein n=1 Tax=Sphingobacterium griseoflavum TaxID=1474952 RepID=A0ABQ3HV05_9SPHI|nr:hypothetical protein [Sphingobacterium griseoflavum]GHE29125.1 hypothetical protein GCM10017764_09750 [Sphingobacterium griseoflavum]
MDLNEVRFNFYKLSFTPVKANEHLRQKDILNKIIQACTPKFIKNKVYLIDRYESRISTERRELFISYITYNHLENRYKGTIALIRNGKKPFLKPKESYQLVPLDSLDLGTLTETTHFFIDTSSDKPYLCVEFNNIGPRISDIEYYFRNLGQKYLNITKKTEVEVFLKRPIKSVLENLKSVLSFDFKIEPKKVPLIDKTVANNYFTSFNNLNSKFDPKFLSMKAYYQSRGKNKNGDSIKGLAFIKQMLQSFSTGHTDLDTFDSFTLEYLDQNDEYDKINFIRDQKEIVIHADLKSVVKNRDWYDLIKVDFDEFMASLHE